MPSSLCAIAILAGVALGLATWKALTKDPTCGRGLSFALTLAALGLAFGAWSTASWIAPLSELSALLADDLGRFMGALFLGLSSLAWLGGGAEGAALDSVRAPHPTPNPLPPDVRGRSALFLLATCGGLIALSAADLLTLWVGLSLYALARSFNTSLPEPELGEGLGVRASPRPALREGSKVRAMLGLAAALMGLALLYASAGTSELLPLGRYLWERGGPRPAILYAGAALTLGGIALLAGFLPPYALEDAEDEASATVLGAALLARLCLYPLGALSWEWSWALILAAIGALAWACAAFLLKMNAFAPLERLMMAQRGFLLLALGLAFHEQGLVALFTALPAYGLAQAILSLSLRWLQSNASDALPIDSLKGLARGNPWLGAPPLISLLSFVGVPATLGFIGRVRLLWAAQVAELPGLVVAILLASGLYSSAYLPLALALLQRDREDNVPLVPPWPLRLAMALAALALIALGLYPQPLIRWAMHIVQTGPIP